MIADKFYSLLGKKRVQLRLPNFVQPCQNGRECPCSNGGKVAQLHVHLGFESDIPLINVKQKCTIPGMFQGFHPEKAS